MAGRGKPPAEDGDKLNRPSRRPDPTDLPRDGHDGAAPKLGSAYRVRRWDPKRQEHTERTVKFLAETTAWYTVWATSPQATRFTATTWQRLRMVARLVDRFHRGEVELMAEIRLNEAKLGATPDDLQRLHWRVVDPPKTGAAAATADSATAAGPRRRARTARKDPRYTTPRKRGNAR